MAQRKNEFDEFMREVEADAKARGELDELAAYAAHFRLARQVIEIREKEGWTQQQFAKKTGVQQSEICRIERGQATPTFRTLQQIAHALKKTIGFVDANSQSRRGARRPATA